MTEENNKRKLRVWDSAALTKIHNDTVQFISGIEEIYIEDDEVTTMSQLPGSVVPTNTLYDICVGFGYMYNKMLEENLIKSGFPKQTTTIH